MGISDATFYNWRKALRLSPSARPAEREGWRDNCTRVHRLYRLEGLSLRHKRPRRNRSARLRQPKQVVNAINEIWSADFVANALFDGRRLRALTWSTTKRVSV